MDAIKAILTRRSIRKFKPLRVPEKLVTALLEAAMYAPSARDYRPWHFLVIDDRKLLDEIVRFHPYAAMLKQAPLAILTCGDLVIEESEGYNALNCAAATQNILLAAHALGLGAVWLGIYPRDQRVAQIKTLFGLPEHILPVSLIAVGYPAEKKPRPQRFDRSRIRRNKWE